MKKLLLILICLFVFFVVFSFVWSKDTVLQCDGILKYRVSDKPEERKYTMIVYLNERKKYLGNSDKKSRNSSKSREETVKLIKSKFQKTDEYFSVFIVYDLDTGKELSREDIKRGRLSEHVSMYYKEYIYLDRYTFKIKWRLTKGERKGYNNKYWISKSEFEGDCRKVERKI